MPNSVCNLLAKHMLRSALVDEVEEGWPEMALIFLTFLVARCGERLTWAGSCPDWLGAGDACKLEGIRPSADPGKKVALSILGEFMGLNFYD